MRVAVAYDEGNVFQHFGHTKEFMIYDIIGDQVTAMELIGTEDFGHCALADLLKENEVCAVICGGIGPGAINALMAANVEVFAGYEGKAIDALEAVLTGKAMPSNDANCNHHNGEKCGEGHKCGHNGCGGGNCCN